MTISSDTIILSNITAQLDDLTCSLADVPGRAPQDVLMATALLRYVLVRIQCHDDSRMLMDLMRYRGADKAEAEAIAAALEALALRLGAWLGRER